MFTTNYHQQYEINLGQNQEEKIEIIMPKIKTENYTFKGLEYKDSIGSTVSISDPNEKTQKFILGSEILFKITPSRFANPIYYSKENYGHVLEVKNSNIIKGIDAPPDMTENLKNARHIVLPLKNAVIEMITSVPPEELENYLSKYFVSSDNK